MKELSFEKMENLNGGWPGECFFAIPIFVLTAGAGLANYSSALGRVAYCWVT